MLLPFLLIFGHRYMIRLRRRNNFFLSWTISSLVLGSCSLLFAFSELTPPEVNVGLIGLVIMSVVCLEKTMQGPTVLPSDVDEITRRSTRAHRCSISGAVVVKYDHYCVWVGASVGHGNHRAYISFLASILVLCVSTSCVLSHHVPFCEPSSGHDHNLATRDRLQRCLSINESSFVLVSLSYLQIVVFALVCYFLISSG